MRRELPEALWLVLPLALVVAPHAPNLPIWLPAVWAVLAGWRLLRAARAWPAPPGWLRALIALAGLAAVFGQFGTVVGPQAGVALLVFLSAAKLMETDTARDRTALVFVGYFLLVAHFLQAQGLLTAAYMLVALVALTASLIAAQMPDPRSVAPKLRQAGWLLLQALPLAALLFLLFPRLAGPLWGLPHLTEGQTGLSDRMSPGDISRLIQSDAIALRASLDRRVEPRQLYWRGPVLWDYDGRTWQSLAPLPAESVRGQGLGPTLQATVILEPHGQRWLFVLGLPRALPRLEATLGPDLQWQARRPVAQRLQYRLETWLDYQLGLEPSAAMRARGLAIPAASNPRAQALAQGWARQGRGDAAIVEQALTLFREQPFYYTLNPPRLGAQAVDGFLFETRRGFCEHYASAFVFLMRAAGVPARVVTGYQGGEYNPAANYWIVRQRDAHAWAEVWLAGRGWVRVDPTAAVAPDRVERGIDAALPLGERPAGLFQIEAGWLAPARLAWDAVNYRWNLWVLGYDEVRQRQLLAQLSPALATLQGMLWALVAGACLLVFGLAAALLWRRQAETRDPASLAYARFCRRLARCGIARQPAEGAEHFAHRAAAQRPDLAEAIERITRLYLAQRYGPSPRTSDVQALRTAVRRFRPSLRR